MGAMGPGAADGGEGRSQINGSDFDWRGPMEPGTQVDPGFRPFDARHMGAMPGDDGSDGGGAGGGGGLFSGLIGPGTITGAVGSLLGGPIVGLVAGLFGSLLGNALGGDSGVGGGGGKGGGKGHGGHGGLTGFMDSLEGNNFDAKKGGPSVQSLQAENP